MREQVADHVVDVVRGREKPLEMFVEVAFRDCLRAAQPGKGFALHHQLAVDWRAFAPEAFHDQLEVSRLDLDGGVRVLHAPFAGRCCGAEVLGADLFQDRVDQVALYLHSLIQRRLTLVVDTQRTLDGFARRFNRKAPEAKRVAEQVGDALAESIELGEAVLAQANQKMRTHVAPIDRGRKLAVKRRPRGVGVVEEVLLELIEQDVELPAKLLEGRINPLTQRQLMVDVERRALRECDGGRAVGLQPIEVVFVRPVAEVEHRGLRLVPQLRDDPRLKNGALADGARSVENGQR